MSARSAPAAPGAFSAYEVGQVISAASARLEAKTTRPPERYTQATLLDDMVHAFKFGRNDTEREMLRQSGGLGTSRTRVPMITALIRRGLLETVKVGKAWQITCGKPARHMLALVPEELRNVAMTARWEIAFKGIRAGKFPPEAVITNGYKFVDQLIDGLRAQRQARGPQGGPGSKTAP